MADRYYQSDEPLDIFGSDPMGRNYIYGLSGNGDGLGLQPPIQGLPVDTRPYDRMQATPRSFISGLFSDVLGGALNMPDLPKTGVPALDLFYANRKPLMNLMGVGDVQKTAERISYGEPLTSGAGGIGGTSRPLPETFGAALTVAPFAPAVGRVIPKVVRATEGLPVGMSIKPVRAPQETALELAKINAAKTGQSLDAYPRSLQQGYEHDWYHGTTGDITNFRQDLLGETTGAESAKKGFFFARDPQNPPASMKVKTTDPASIELLRQLGKTDEEIAALNQVSMKGFGAETASGYAQIGGSREYKEAMRKAKAAEKRGNWDEYEKQMQIAEDSEIQRMQEAQSLVAKYGDARDQMLDTIQKTIYNKNLTQAEAEALDKKYMELMPYGWYNSFDPQQFNQLKNQLVALVGEDAATPALKQIDNFKSIRSERMIAENTQQGGNVMPVALRYKNPMVYDFGGASYREQTYSDLVDQALRGGHDALILKNTFDPAGGQSKLIDVGVVFSPAQIRSRFAAFDPFRKDVATATAMGVALPDLLAQPVEQYPTPYETTPMYTDPFGNTIGSSIR